MITSRLSSDANHALHIVTGKVSSADIVKAIYEVRGKGVDLVVWDLRRGDFSIDTGKLETTITVTLPTQKRLPDVVFLVSNQSTATFWHSLLTRVVPPWPWRISTDPIEAEQLVSDVFATA